MTVEPPTTDPKACRQGQDLASGERERKWVCLGQDLFSVPSATLSPSAHFRIRVGSPAPSPPAVSGTTTPRRLCGYLAPFFSSLLPVTPANNSWRKHLRAFFIHKLSPGWRHLYHSIFLFINKCSRSSALFRLQYPEVSGLLFPRPSVERLPWRQQDAGSLKNKAGPNCKKDFDWRRGHTGAHAH